MTTPAVLGRIAMRSALLLSPLATACAYPAYSWQTHSQTIERTSVAAAAGGGLDARPAGDRPGVIVIEPSGVFAVRQAGQRTTAHHESVGGYNPASDLIETLTVWMVVPLALLDTLFDSGWRSDLRAYADISNGSALVGSLPLVSVLGQDRGNFRTQTETTEPWESVTEGPFPAAGVFEVAWLHAAGAQALCTVDAADGPVFDLSRPLAIVPASGMVRLRITVRGSDPPIATTTLVPWVQRAEATRAGSAVQ